MPVVMRATVEGQSQEVVAPDLNDEDWLELRTEHQRIRHRSSASLCRCSNCGHALHPKQMRTTRFFAHNPDPDNPCPLRVMDHSESPDHRNLKLSIYRAVKREPGWDAMIESIAPEKDPVTKKPIIVDVTAERRRNIPARDEVPRVQGWEVQLGSLDEGKALERQEVRQRWLGRCTWVTRSDRASWADRIPWYQVRTVDELELVVDGVNRWDQAAGTYVNEEPFPADQMVGYMLRGAFWAQDAGWRLEFANQPGHRGQRRRSQSTRSMVGEYCDRLGRLPEEIRRWSDADWRRYAPLAHEKRNRGETLTDLERIAISRFPTVDSELAGHEFEPHIVLPYRQDDLKPCFHCRQPVAVSVAADYPLHHHCAWHIARQEECSYV